MYLDFNLLLPASLGDSYNSLPSILVMHNATSTALLKNIHGEFKGLILADRVEHLNGDLRLLGRIVSWAQCGNVYGKESAEIRFSSAVLAALPPVTSDPYYDIVSWREILTN